MQAQHLTFDGVQGYATYDNAKKRGEEIAFARRSETPGHTIAGSSSRSRPAGSRQWSS